MIRKLAEVSSFLVKNILSGTPTPYKITCIAPDDPIAPPLSPKPLGFLQHPWWRVKRIDVQGAKLVLVRYKCRGYFNFELSSSSTKRFEAVLDTGSGSSLLRCSDLSYGSEKFIKPQKGSTNIREGNTKPITMAGNNSAGGSTWFPVGDVEILRG